MMVVALCVAAYVVCGILAYGITLAHFTRKFPTINTVRSEAGFAVFIGLCGPFGLATSFALSGCAAYGLRFR